MNDSSNGQNGFAHQAPVQGQPPTGPVSAVDMQYFSRVAARMSRLEQSGTLVKMDIDNTKKSISRLHNELSEEFRSLNTEIALLQSGTDRAISDLKSTLLQFKTVVKQNELSRLQSRIDVWNPQGKITRDQFKIMIRKTVVQKDPSS